MQFLKRKYQHIYRATSYTQIFFYEYVIELSEAL